MEPEAVYAQLNALEEKSAKGLSSVGIERTVEAMFLPYSQIAETQWSLLMTYSVSS